MQKTGGLESGDIIKFYNDVFVHATKRFLVQLGSNFITSPSGAHGLEGDDGKMIGFSDDEFKYREVFISQANPFTNCTFASPHSARMSRKVALIVALCLPQFIVGCS